MQHATATHKQYIFNKSETIVNFTQRFTEALCKLFDCYKYIHTYTILFMWTIQKPLKRIRSHILATKNLTTEQKLCVSRHHFRPIRISHTSLIVIWRTESRLLENPHSRTVCTFLETWEAGKRSENLQLDSHLNIPYIQFKLQMALTTYYELHYSKYFSTWKISLLVHLVLII